MVGGGGGEGGGGEGGDEACCSLCSSQTCWHHQPTLRHASPWRRCIQVWSRHQGEEARAGGGGALQPKSVYAVRTFLKTKYCFSGFCTLTTNLMDSTWALLFDFSTIQAAVCLISATLLTLSTGELFISDRATLEEVFGCWLCLADNGLKPPTSPLQLSVKVRYWPFWNSSLTKKGRLTFSSL